MKNYLATGLSFLCVLAACHGEPVQSWTIKGLQIVRLDLGKGGANCYVICNNNREAYVVDPGQNAPAIVEYLKSKQLKVLAYLVTHAHNDHINALPQLMIEMPAPVGMQADDVPMYQKKMGDSGLFDLSLKDNQTYGTNALAFIILHTPGHSPGGICIYFKQAGVIFTGDTLFSDTVGLSNLEQGNETALRSSLLKLQSLPSQTEIFPGHGPKTSMQLVRQQNPFMKQK